MQAITELAIQIGLFYFFILIGYTISRLTVRSESLNKHLNALLINILIPALVIYTLVSASSDAYAEVSTVIVFAIIIANICYFISIKREREARKS